MEPNAEINQEFDLDHDFFLSNTLPPRQPPPSLPQTVSPNLWDPRLVLDLAVGVDSLEDILIRYDLSEREFELLNQVQAFRRELALTIRDVRENGVPFTSKARVQAESYLEVVDNMVLDSETPASVRLDAIKSIVKWGKLEPKDDKASDTTNATQINVNISF